MSRHARLRSRLSPRPRTSLWLSQATRASRDSSRSSRPNPRDRQQQQQLQRQPHRPTAASRQRQPFRGKNRSLPQSSTKKGGAAARINIDCFTDSTSPTTPSSAASPDPPPLPVLPVPYVPGPVGGRLHFFWQNWQAIQADEWVVSILRDGYFLPFDSAPPLTADPPCLSYSATHPLFQDMSHHCYVPISSTQTEKY